MWLTPHATGFKFLEHFPPVVWSQNTHGEGTLFPLSRQQSEGLKMVTINMINISLPPWHKTKLLSLLNKVKWMISRLEVKLSQSTSFSLILLIGIFRSFMIIHCYKCLIDQFDNKPTLFQVMAWCHHARSHYVNLCWPRSQMLYCMIRPQ